MHEHVMNETLSGTFNAILGGNVYNVMLHVNPATLRGLTVLFCVLYNVVLENHSVQNSSWGLFAAVLQVCAATSRPHSAAVVQRLRLSRLFIAALWSPAGKGLTPWLLLVMFNCVLSLSYVVSWVRCGT